MARTCCSSLLRIYPCRALAYRAVEEILAKNLQDEAMYYTLMYILTFEGKSSHLEQIDLSPKTLQKISARMVQLLLKPGFITENEGRFEFPHEKERYLILVCQQQPYGQVLASWFLRKLLEQLCATNLSVLCHFLITYLPKIVITSAEEFDRTIIDEWRAAVQLWGSPTPPESHYVSPKLLSETLLSLDLV